MLEDAELNDDLIGGLGLKEEDDDGLGGEVNELEEDEGDA